MRVNVDPRERLRAAAAIVAADLARPEGQRLILAHRVADALAVSHRFMALGTSPIADIGRARLVIDELTRVLRDVWEAPSAAGARAYDLRPGSAP